MTPRHALDIVTQRAAAVPHYGTGVQPLIDSLTDLEALRRTRLNQYRMAQTMRAAGHAAPPGGTKHLRLLELVAAADSVLHHTDPEWAELSPSGKGVTAVGAPYRWAIGELARGGSITTVTEGRQRQDGVPVRELTEIRLTPQGADHLEAMWTWWDLDEALKALVRELDRGGVRLREIAKYIPRLDDPAQNVASSWVRDGLSQRDDIAPRVHTPWGVMLDAVQGFHAQHGRFPRRSEDHDGHPVGTWLATQRQRRRAGKMPAEQNEALDTIGNWCPPAADMVAGGAAWREVITA